MTKRYYEVPKSQDEFVDSYLDYVENIPNLVQIHLTTIRQHDCDAQIFFRKLDQMSEMKSKERNSALDPAEVENLHSLAVSVMESQDAKLREIQEIKEYLNAVNRIFQDGYTQLTAGNATSASNRKYVADSDVGTPTIRSIATSLYQPVPRRLFKSRFGNNPSSPSATAASEESAETAAAAAATNKDDDVSSSSSSRNMKELERAAMALNELASFAQRIDDDADDNEPDATNYIEALMDVSSNTNSTASTPTPSLPSTPTPPPRTSSRRSANNSTPVQQTWSNSKTNSSRAKGKNRKSNNGAIDKVAKDQSGSGNRKSTGKSSSARKKGKGGKAKRKLEPELYCICNGPSRGPMVKCDNDNCLLEWFHFKCVGLIDEPKGDWYCSDCQPFDDVDKSAKGHVDKPKKARN